MKATIERVVNGYIVTTEDNEVIAICEDHDASECPEAYSTAEALRAAIDYLGAAGSRYDEARVRVSVEPGDKFDDSSSCQGYHDDDDGGERGN